MAKIRSKRTKPEMRVHSHLKARHIRHEMWPEWIYGHPDVLVYPDVAVFVNGCFWHGCSRHFRCPKTNRAFWRKKIARNLQRQRQVRMVLRRQGYTAIVVWEHDLNKTTIEAVIGRIKSCI